MEAVQLLETLLEAVRSNRARMEAEGRHLVRRRLRALNASPQRTAEVSQTVPISLPPEPSGEYGVEADISGADEVEAAPQFAGSVAPIPLPEEPADSPAPEPASGKAVPASVPPQAAPPHAPAPPSAVSAAPEPVVEAEVQTVEEAAPAAPGAPEAPVAVGAAAEPAAPLAPEPEERAFHAQPRITAPAPQVSRVQDWTVGAVLDRAFAWGRGR